MLSSFEDCNILKKINFKKDFAYFSFIIWNENLEDFMTKVEEAKNDIAITWLGHAAFLFRINGTTILTVKGHSARRKEFHGNRY